MQADREHPRVVVEGHFHTVSVMCIQVDVGDPPHPIGQQPGDGDCSVVVDTKSRRPSRHGVMEAAGEIYGVNHLTCTHGTRASTVPSVTRAGSLMHQVGLGYPGR